MLFAHPEKKKKDNRNQGENLLKVIPNSKRYVPVYPKKKKPTKTRDDRNETEKMLSFV